MRIRPADSNDHEAIWRIFHDVISTGDTYVFDPTTPRTEALAYWFRADTHTYVAEHEGTIIGTYIIRPNQPGLGSHVANGSYMVSKEARGLGTGRAMGEHSLIEAKHLGFRAIQFNIVVSTNEAAIRLWRKLGFRILATLPGTYRHSRLGFVDAHLMFRQL